MSSKPSHSTKLKAKPTKALLKPSNGSKKDVKSSKSVTVKSLPVADESASENSDEDDVQDEDDNEEDSDESEDVDEAGMKRLMELLGEEGLDDIAKEQLGLLQAGEDDEEEEEDDDDDEASEEGDEDEDVDGLQDELEEVDLEDAEEVDEDAVVRQKVLINNKTALERIRATIQLDSSLPWTETLAVTSDEKIEVDVNDDLKRELAFYKQALSSTNTARTLAAKHNLPFSRPADFYAEMVKSDSHMERIRQRLLDETAGIKRSEEKKREREGKKFGKKVQVEKLKEREKGKKDMDERLKGIKRKRKDALDQDEDFDIQLESALTDRPAKRAAHTGANGKPSMSRKGRDSKFGFGGKVGRRAKQNTKESTDSFGGRDGGRGGGGGGGGAGKGGGGKYAGGGKYQGAKGGKRAPAKRLGKSRRMKVGK